MDIARFDNTQDIVEKVFNKHSRKVSQLQGLEDELGQYFDEEEAERIARETMKEMRPNDNKQQEVSVDHIVAEVKKKHTRKVSQFRAIKNDLGQYLPENEAAKMAAEVMKDINPNETAGKRVEVSVDGIVKEAMDKHQRRKSQMAAIENDLGLIFDKDDVKAITKDAMKTVFAQKHANSDQNVIYEIGSTDPVEKMQRRVNRMDKELKDKENMIFQMKQQIEELERSKRELAINSSKCLDQMRHYLKEYQNAIFAKKSDV
eukprot:CAMPEP_0201567388 /NCGR_PEP_ID=MMETSP0190_2-20130828/7890_1 /ASSEMBLY_ACC=CAM_ASM_000263 /TAXON_ID=37353 /ORGANISM="Rosalina sp." /LENGTH=259 /DNA_ID=CAMNT_0047987337 /DNA_START=57 /DNA_END=836 /DNA_ORIENTATION=+